ncbi:MerR family transcriptional regulator [Paenibacillus sp. sgz500958]|uniref:MerR family transcriptional regulator n=1 Tax=Paenibacillus sp. sgz500958 TaxID=3242475 RepID=UPI0036D2B0B0
MTTFTIKDVAETTGLSIFTIRFYDKEGLLPFVSKDASGRRVFTESDLYMIRTICCLKNTGMQIKEIKKYIDYCMEGTSSIDLRKNLMAEHRQKILADIEALRENLNLVESKLEIYDSPHAVEIINGQIQHVGDEKRKNSLPNPYSKDKIPN